MNTVSGQSTDKSSVQTDLHITDDTGIKKFHLKNVRSVPTIPVNVSSMASIELTHQYTHLKDISLPCSGSATVDILIGSDCPDLFVIEDQRIGSPGDPYACKYALGWAIIGPIPMKSAQDEFTVNLQITNEQLSKSFTQMWTTDFPDVAATSKNVISVDDRIASQIVEKSIKKKEQSVLAQDAV